MSTTYDVRPVGRNDYGEVVDLYDARGEFVRRCMADDLNTDIT